MEAVRYCHTHKVEHGEQEDCPVCAVDSWRSDKNGGWIVAFLLFPFVAVGFAVGLVWEGFRVGFQEAQGTWSKAMAAIRKEMPSLKITAKG